MAEGSNRVLESSEHLLGPQSRIQNQGTPEDLRFHQQSSHERVQWTLETRGVKYDVKVSGVLRVAGGIRGNRRQMEGSLGKFTFRQFY